MRRESRILVRVLALTGAVWLLGSLPQPSPTEFWDAIYNAGHAPLFGFVALCILSVTRILLPGAPWLRLYLFAFVTATGLGAASELVQYFGPRNADLGDFFRNAAGAAAFLIFRRVMETGPGRKAVIASVLASVLLLAVLVPVVFCLFDYRARDTDFPVLYRFDSSWGRTFVRPVASRLETDSLPDRFGEPAGRRSGRWTLYARPWPGLIVEEPVPDWTGYQAVRLEIRSGLDRPVPMTLMVVDRLHHSGSEDRARVRFTVQPGLNEIVIDLDRIRIAPSSRPLEINQVALFTLYAKRPEEPFTLWIDSVRLE